MIPSQFLFGAAYYDEYMPYDRIDTDFQLMRDAGMNVIRIAESTWSTWEPTDGNFDFTHLNRMLNVAQKYDLQVIIGTPTYAIPSWLAKKHPDILSTTKDGPSIYGHRQLSDITNPNYRRYAERIIRRLMEEIKDVPHIIGFQLDNETRSGGDTSPRTQALFVRSLKEKYPDINGFNRAFGLDYWSNRVDDWDAFPDIRGTINGSLSAAYKAFLRDQITEFLHWQCNILKEYIRKDQFITHNFDFSWITCSHGIHPEVNQKDCAEFMDIAGTDIYHLSQDNLDGATIAFGGSVGRSLKKAPYLVLETQSQGQVQWLPYPGQLRLQAYSHLSNGAASVMYWNWHSIHNAIESYWKGILSHDLKPGRIYDELNAWRHEITGMEDHLQIIKKQGVVAILADNRSLNGIDEFPYQTYDEPGQYNNVLREIYDTLYKMNIETDIVYRDDDFSAYPILIVPMLYSADEDTIRSLEKYVENGGHLLVTFRSFFSDENIKIYPDDQPHGLTGLFGMSYSEFTIPKDVSVSFSDNPEIDNEKEYPVKKWMEFLTPTTADVWARYVHHDWNGNAITHNRYGSGSATYLGAGLDETGYHELIKRILNVAGIPIPENKFPTIRRNGINRAGKNVIYLINYSSEPGVYNYDGKPGHILVDENGISPENNSAKTVSPGDKIELAPWNLVVVETE